MTNKKFSKISNIINYIILNYEFDRFQISSVMLPNPAAALGSLRVLFCNGNPSGLKVIIEYSKLKHNFGAFAALKARSFCYFMAAPKAKTAF